MLRPETTLKRVAFHLAARAWLQVHVCLHLRLSLNLEKNNLDIRRSMWDFKGYTMSDRLYESGGVPDKTPGGMSEASVDRAGEKSLSPPLNFWTRVDKKSCVTLKQRNIIMDGISRGGRGRVVQPVSE